MSANSGSGGVRNLRAMFENKAGDQSTSPPSRGRSPAHSEVSNNSRPVSKVRASFVAIERPGENGGAPILGLRRASEVSSVGGRGEQPAMDTIAAPKPSAASETPPKEEIPSDAGKTLSGGDGTAEGGLGEILKGSAFVENTPSKPSADTTSSSQPSAAPKPEKSVASKPKDEAKAATMVEKMQASKQSDPGPPPKTTLQTTKTAQPVKPPHPKPIATKPAPKSPVASKASPRTPTSPLTHLRGGPGKIKGVMESAKQAQQAREAMAKQAAPKTEKAQPVAPKLHTQPQIKPASEGVKKDQPSIPTTPKAVKKHQTPAPTSPKAVKSPKFLKPKSPTRPTKLPAAAVANTASSAAKHDAKPSPTESEFRKPVNKRPSTVSMRPPRVSTSSMTGTLAKKTSRASLATNGHDRPSSRVSTSKPDEGFLARMMRPTASSAQKAHDKVAVHSPPRKDIGAATTKHKEGPTKHKGPPKMHLDEPKQENKDNDDPREESVLPEVAPASPLEVVKQDPMSTAAETEAVEGAEASEPANGEPGEPTEF